jgi:hypothetical protein
LSVCSARGVGKSICRCACDPTPAARRGSGAVVAARGEVAQGGGGKDTAFHGEGKEKGCGCPSDAAGLRPRGRPCVGAAGDEDGGGGR